MTSPITRRLLRQADEAEAAIAGSPGRTRCAHRIIRTQPTGSRYSGACKRPARASGLCWQHERSATR